MADLRDLKFRRDNLEVDLELAEAKLKTAQLRAQANRPGATQEVIDATAEINRIRAALAAINVQINQVTPPDGTSSAGDVVTAGQAARDDNANPQNPTAPQVIIVPESRINTSVEVGTNDPTRSLTQTQSTPPASINEKLTNQSTGAPASAPGQTAGVGSRSDDSPPPSSGGAQAVINAAFSTPANARIVAQPNVLNQFASYTYAISWYLLTPTQYNAMQTTKRKDTSGWQLLMQSGGAPTQQAAGSAGRNQYFDLDYYLDDLEIDSMVPLKGTNMAHSATDIRFKVVEPNGITLINNLYRAVNDLYKSSGPTNGGTTAVNSTYSPNYPMAQYCLAVRFYGYDEQGNLAQLKGQSQSTNTQALIEKFYPFVISNIKFRMANRAVEYEVQGKPMGQFYNLSQDRGTIPFGFQLIGETVQDVLVGKAVGTVYNVREDGRQDSPTPKKSTLSAPPIPYTGTYLDASQMQANQQWYNQYGSAYNADGSPKVS